MKTLLFDLDGTLLPMIQDEFVNCYYKLLVRKLLPFGIDPTDFIDALNTGAYYMVLNDGTRTNEEAFWIGYETVMAHPEPAMEQAIYDFYANEFNEAIVSTQPTPLARKIIDLCREKGYQIICATSPLFPRTATYNRLRWAGLEAGDFEYVTTYEECTFCKPSPGYYQMLIDRFNIDPSEAMMIGNDPSEDMPARELGFNTYLVTDTIENRSNNWVEPDYRGSLADLYEFINELDQKTGN